jgi:hypothetical protein
MILNSEEAKSLMLTIPVSPDALEASGAIMESMSQDSNFGFI